MIRSPFAAVTAGLMLASGVASAGTTAAESTVWDDACKWLSSKPGVLYKNADNPWIEEVNFSGRIQWQAAYLSGNDTKGYNFSDDYTDLRRFRLDTRISFLRWFGLRTEWNLAKDFRNSTTRFPGNDAIHWGGEDFDVLAVSFDAAKAFNLKELDQLSIAYGRWETYISQEGRVSSKELLTVERSALANKIYEGFRPTGVRVEAAKGPWNAIAAVFSSDTNAVGGNVEGIGGWNDGVMYYGLVGYQVNKKLSFALEGMLNEANALKEDNLLPYKWTTSLSGVYKADPAGLVVDLILGDNGDAEQGNKALARQGGFGGLVVTPYYWIVPKTLQGVVQYQFAASEEDQGIRAYSRYFRADHGPKVNVNKGYGDEHHELYAGLNWYLCGHNLKVQGGVQYEWLNTPGVGTGDATALTWLLGLRSFF